LKRETRFSDPGRTDEREQTTRRKQLPNCPTLRMTSDKTCQHCWKVTAERSCLVVTGDRRESGARPRLPDRIVLQAFHGQRDKRWTPNRTFTTLPAGDGVRGYTERGGELCLRQAESSSPCS
jgi:hypothetical protein